MPPNGWTCTGDQDPPYTWHIVDSTDADVGVHDGNYAAAVKRYHVSSQDEWLISPELDLSGYEEATLEFWAASWTWNPGATVKVIVDGDGINDEIWDMIRDEVWETVEYRNVTIDLSNYVGETITICFQYVGMQGWHFGLDDVLVTIGELTADAGGPYEAEAGEEIQFDGTASNGVPPYSYHWDFGDESGTSDVEDPTYTYDDAGVYTVNLTVTDSERAVAWDETTATITEPPPPPAELDITEIAGGMGVTATIKNIGGAAATNLEWNIKVTGGFLGLVDADVDGNKSSLAVDATEDAASGSLGFLHLGGLEMEVTADADNANKVTKKATAFIVGPFVIGVQTEE